MEKDDEVKGEGNSYDFGARLYDSRIGKFLSVDPAFKLQPASSAYMFGGNNPIYYIYFQGLFKWPNHKDEEKRTIFENKYPNFTKILKNIHKMPEMYETLISSLCKNTGLSESEIKNNLLYGEGAIIVIKPKGDWKHDTFKFSNPNKNEIAISETVLNKLEEMSQEKLDVASVAVAITLLHEETHRGDRISNNGSLTGQWNSRVRIDKSLRYYEDGAFKYEGFGSDIDQKPGTQKYTWSPFTGHRVSDVEYQVFRGGYFKLTGEQFTGFNFNFNGESSDKEQLYNTLGIDKVNETSKLLLQ